MTKIFSSLCIALAALTSCKHSAPSPTPTADPMADEDSLYIVVGSYDAGDTMGAVSIYAFDQNIGGAKLVSVYSGISNPSYAAPSADGSRIYVVSETEDRNASLHALAFDRKTNKISELNSVLTNGQAPCHVAISPDGEYAVTANYLGNKDIGSISVFALRADGAIQKRTDVFGITPSYEDTTYTATYRSNYSVYYRVGIKGGYDKDIHTHAHYISFHPSGKKFTATDLGGSQLIEFGISPGYQLEKATHKVLPKGNGPRHIDYTPDRKFAYLINELSGTITAFANEGDTLTTIAEYLADSTRSGASADIHVSPDGKHLYSSHRRQANYIAIHAIAPDGTLTHIGTHTTPLHPRNFAISPNGKYIIVAGRDDNTIEVLARNSETGLLSKLPDNKGIIKTSKPSSIRFMMK